MSFLKIVNQMGSFGEKRKKCFFRFCRPILDIFGFPLLMTFLFSVNVALFCFVCVTIKYPFLASRTKSRSVKFPLRRRAIY